MYALVQYHPLWQQQYYRQVVDQAKMIDHNIGITRLLQGEIKQQKEQRYIRYVEQEFKIQLKELTGELKHDLGDKNVFVYIGTSREKKNCYIRYNIKNQQFDESIVEGNIIVAYSEENYITSSEYLRCMIDVVIKSLQMKKRPIIYCDMEIMEQEIKYRSLYNKVICNLIEKVNGLVICRADSSLKPYYQLTTKPFEPYINHIVYTTDGPQKALHKLKRCDLQKVSTRVFKREYYKLRVEQDSPYLYQDVFYQQIQDETMIYVPILPNSEVSKEAYEELGFEYIMIQRGYGILYGPKKKFDEQRKKLIKNVLPQFTPQIMTYTYPVIQEAPANFQFNPRKVQRYNGKGVYIGIIGVEGISDNPDNDKVKRQVAYVWEQIEGGNGKEYEGESIQGGKSAEKSDLENQSFNSVETLTIGMIGGKGKTPEGEFRGVATEAEFIVAKIKRAPDELQGIYGGVPSSQAVLLEDVLIGIDKLVEFTNSKGKPLVICIPFGTNISSHDGSMPLQDRMKIFTEQPGITIVVPTGEEADKHHHMQISLQDTSEYDIEIEQPLNKVVGLISIESRLMVNILLKNLTSQQNYMLLEQAVYREGETTILTGGAYFNYSNGKRQILFSMENGKKDKWALSLQALNIEPTSLGKVSVWISQQEVNPFVRLRPADTFTTIQSLGNIEGILCVGNYDNASNTTFKSSGRGYTSQNLITPVLAAQGKDVPYLDQDNKWQVVTGGIAVMANMAAVAAAVYSKALEQKILRLPNTPIMSSLLIGQVNQLDTVQYPNPSQGYGIFDRTSLDRILNPSELLKI